MAWWPDTFESKSLSKTGSQTNILQFGAFQRKTVEIIKNQNSEICFEIYFAINSHKKCITWSVDPSVPPVSQEPPVSDLPSDVLPSETCEQPVLKYLTPASLISASDQDWCM